MSCGIGVGVGMRLRKALRWFWFEFGWVGEKRKEEEGEVWYGGGRPRSGRPRRRMGAEKGVVVLLDRIL
jgi:hypothetical protein